MDAVASGSVCVFVRVRGDVDLPHAGAGSSVVMRACSVGQRCVGVVWEVTCSASEPPKNRFCELVDVGVFSLSACV